MVNQAMESDIPGIFACGNVLHVHDLVDYVVEEAREAAIGAVQYLNGELTHQGHLYEVNAGNGIGYVVPQLVYIDDVKDKLVSGEAAMGVIFSGEALRMMLENEDLAYVVPKEGTNLWIDSWVIPKNAAHVENAHAFIDFMSRPDIALKNFEYLTYSTPNTAVPEMEEDEDYKDNPVVFPPPEVYEGQETYQDLGEDGDKMYNEGWIQVKVY